MGCRKNSPGKPCCDTDPCPPECDDFYTPSYYDAVFTLNGITKTVRLNKGTSFPCEYGGFICWADASEKLGDITIEIEPGYTIPTATDCFLGSVNTICDRTEDFSEYDFDTGNGQVTEIKRGRPSYSYAVTSGHYKHKIQRWGKRRYSVDIRVYPIVSGDTALRMKVLIVSSQAIRYSASCCTQAVHAIVTCPACSDQTCVTTFEFYAPTGTVCVPSPHVKPTCTLGSWIGYAAITLDEPIDPFGEVATDCSSVPPFPWNPSLPVNCPGTPEYGTTSVTVTGVSCVASAWTTFSYSVTVNTGTVCYNDSISHYCLNGCLFQYCTSQEDTEYYQEVEYFSEPFECTDSCGPIAVYRDTPEPEITGLPTENYPAGETTDADCVTYYGSMSQKRKFIAWPATFNVTICDE